MGMDQARMAEAVAANPSYSYIIDAIKAEAAAINLTYSTEGDGRLTSAVRETEYLNRLETGLKARYPQLVFEMQPADRWWWDFRVNGIPINLKLTTGGTDNAFNKVAILYTLSGIEVEKRNMNYNQFFTTVKECVKKEERDRMTEYHYLVVHKGSGQILLKSILDIHTYKSNPCNDLQINWASEFKNWAYRIDESEGAWSSKMTELLKTVQTSVRQAIAGMREFADANLDELAA